MGQPTSFGDWVRRRRRALDLTQEALAQQVGCALATIKKIETDERRPSREMAERLADYLRITPDQREPFLRAARNLLAVDDLADVRVPLRPPIPTPATPTAGLSSALTFLFTDIAGSTRLWEQHPDTMPAALARHDTLLRTAIGTQGGQVFKTVGDAFCAAFADPQAALLAALGAQTALAAEMWGTTGPLLVRMALHSGVAELRDGDYFGAPLNRVARLLSLGHGGQVLISAATAELVRDRLPDQASLRDLGFQRLKDLSRPERVFQLDAPGRLSDFPPLRSALAVPHNLPTPPNPLIGREVQLAALGERLRQDDLRLLTLLGPGGTGKTRLALQAAREQLDQHPDGVWFVDLTPIRDPALVLPSIARVLGLRESGNEPIAEQLCAYLRERALLLLLDNLEQVIDAAPDLATLLAEAPLVRMLATSREALRLAGEQVYAVPPLAAWPLDGSDRAQSSLPVSQSPSQLAKPSTLADLPSFSANIDVLSSPAAQLFVARARAARSDLVVDTAGAAAIALICRRLEGLPLAIELAAARVRLLPPQAILERLAHPLDLLTAGARDLPTRQQTLRAAIGWSYDLLTDSEQQLFRRLGVFVGGWDLAAAEAVGGMGVATLDLLAALTDKSLVQQVAGHDGEARFSMLETIREYAIEQLEANGEVQAIRERHAAYFVTLAERASPEEYRPQFAYWLDRMEEEHANLQMAFWTSAERGAYEWIALLCAHLRWFWFYHGHIAEAAHWIELAWAHQQELPSPIRARMLRECAWLISGYERQIEGAETSLALYRALGDIYGEAWALTVVSGLAFFQGDTTRSRGPAEACLPLARKLGDRALLGEALLCLGQIRLLDEQYESAHELFKEGLALSRTAGDQQSVAALLGRLAELAYALGDFQQAETYFAEGAAIRRSFGDRRGMAAFLSGAGDAACRQGAIRHALSLQHEGLTAYRDVGWMQGIGWTLESLAEIANELGQPARAARFLGKAEDIRTTLGIGVWPTKKDEYERLAASVRTALGAEAFTAAFASGRALSLDAAAAEAMEWIDEQLTLSSLQPE